MVRLNQIQEKMSEMHELDSGRFFVDISGETLDEALANAAIQLGMPVSSIDYEILQKGASGFFAIVPKEWKIRAYETIKVKKPQNIEEEKVETEDIIEDGVIINKDGMGYVFCAADGIYFKVTAPSGTGRVFDIKAARDKFRDRALPIPEDDILAPILEEKHGEYVRVAPYKRIPGNDAAMVVNISDDEMKAYLYVTPPTTGGVDLSADTIIAFFKE